jgi:transposase
MGRVALRNVWVDYLLSTSGHISATDLSEALEGRYSHDQISRMLYAGDVDDKTLYQKSKRLIKAKGGYTGVVTLSIDDSIQEKPYSEVNGLVAYHWDHTESRAVKGINFVSALVSDEAACVPMSVQVVEKHWNPEQQAWKVVKSRNDIFQQMVELLTRSGQVQYVLADSWYASKENMRFVREQCDTHFIMALKTNRSAAVSKKEAENGSFVPLPDIMLGKRAVKLYFIGLDFPVRVVKQVFKHGDGSSGTLYLATSDLELNYEQIFSLYKRRWKIEEYHKCLKTNCSLGKCQASSHSAQRSHFYLAALAYLLLEKAKLKEDKNHFALMKQLNILTVKYGIKQVRKQLHATSNKLKMAA